MKARIEVLEFLTKANHTARTKEQCILGWKCSKELIKGTAEDDVSETQPRTYSPTRPNIYEDMELRNITIGLGICSAIFQLNLGLMALVRNSRTSILAFMACTEFSLEGEITRAYTSG
jgi:hypothetical protein